ncbi:hypothetical protein A0H81_03739 [Grifola frondosa]|uniref:Uncharacterized protein n=1 Tax=Grifola frondosa TaxID=5627 RepID=A0A1C7MJR6_GRIFR|nr:hypothetical protein A0H81_03739 [Grifola frondosa]
MSTPTTLLAPHDCAYSANQPSINPNGAVRTDLTGHIAFVTPDIENARSIEERAGQQLQSVILSEWPLGVISAKLKLVSAETISP